MVWPLAGKTWHGNESEDLDAGGFLYFGGGAIVDPKHSSLAFQLSLGYKFDSIELSGASGHTSFSVLPMDAMLFLKADALRISAGLTYYLDPKWEVCQYGNACLVRNFDNALGVAFELRHQWTDILFWGARYSSVEYKDEFISLDANNLRIHFGMVF